MLHARHRTGLVFFPAFDWAISPTHPEREERLLYTQDQVFEEGLLDIDGIREYKPDMVSMRDVQRVHFCVPDVWQRTTESHFISAGGAKTIGMAVMEREVARGFALVRPPGHHAMRVVHGARGFCNINIEAIMVEYLRQAYGITRVAIVDTDCHHGDGTQDIYWHDPDTLFISLHQDGRTLYPGTGFIDELGGPNAAGTTINIPLPPHTADEGFLTVAREVIRPMLDDFQPELVVNSAGQDNHYSDPITHMHFSAQGYAALTELLAPDIAVLEGGYSIEGALPYVNTGIILALAGLDYRQVHEPDFEARKLSQAPQVTDIVTHTTGEVLDRWRKCRAGRRPPGSAGQIVDRTRRIYYDTDDIHEEQNEAVRVCAHCGGAMRIDSRSSSGERILAVLVPRGACDPCRRQARRWFDAPSAKDGYTAAYLNDRVDDQWHEHRFTP